ncbi:hypothetical protein [Salinibacterium sp. M195]|uniref:hypothetical protein n=1 Tax=Salinibacterium sp. M195 TaxID=2583374 RepID=UPI001C636724|nr:hypothetical protein [Salinibacterium sp. M195]QYH36643.1 hypothetical protein FFT87_12200 [Salinibacterium sp. M195]
MSDDRGSSSLEFITVGLIMLIPLVYLVLTMSAIQGGALAAEGAARQAARVFVQAESTAEAELTAQRAVEFALSNYGIDSADASVDIACSPDPTNCLARRGYVTVTVGLVVALPLAPPVLTGNFPINVPLDAAATQQVSQFRGSR